MNSRNRRLISLLLSGGTSVGASEYTRANFAKRTVRAIMSGIYRADGAQSAVIARHLHPYTSTSQSLITNKRANNGSLMRRLIELDRETYERLAHVGVRGEHHD